MTDMFAAHADIPAEPHAARKKWTPRPRPDWVARINAEGNGMDLPAIVPLDPESLLSAAMRGTGLSDFGSDPWREPFEILCRSLDEDAHLNLLGRIRCRSDLLLLLRARLEIEECYRRHPEIEEEAIDHPLFILGQGRTGTSYLLNLLCAAPDNEGFRMWEGVFPCPPPEAAHYFSDPRIARADQFLTQGNRVTPELCSLHEFAGHMPQEDGHLLGMAFRHMGWFNVMAQVDHYNRYLASQDAAPAYRYHRRVLKLLQWRNPRRQWVLKDPTHLEEMATILKVYPDACFVWTHRDPTRAVASTIDLVGTMLWGRSDHPFKGTSFDTYTDPVFAAKRLTDVIAQMECGEIPRDRICNILYRDLVDDPVGAASRIFAHFDLPLSDANRQAIADYVTQNPRSARPPHHYDAETQAMLERMRPAFRAYCDHFGVPQE